MSKGISLPKAQTGFWSLVGIGALVAAIGWWIAGPTWTLNAQASVLVPAPLQKDRIDSEKKDVQPDQPDQKNGARPPALPLPFDDLEDWLGDAPPGVDPKQWEALRQMLRRQREEMQRMIEQLQQGPWFRDRDIWPFGPLSQRPGRLGVV
ncbi:MAG: hypothetical protein RMJ19_12785, partial [Gemmatales bacterium]|nr:hypothetical protein [Gemmatales bacterium]MDW8176543.1 hypothetical protein [Gemmatales bacterium]